MMKDLIINQHPVVEENISNLTSASGEASVSSNNRGENGIYTQHSFDSLNQTPLQKKKRSLPGNPDPDAEVIALSPRSLMATNRFVCEVCNKGFQRDQNLQLHKRGHNLPWKLKQRTSKDVRKKVYVCPEVSCVHHEASRALGDLTGIKKHFCRKHGEKRWKCDKCSKRYAVQSDWKAHSKTCGTREYRCDCGTLFSRRDSFITHRAFCDALAEETAKAITIANPLLSSQPTTSTHLNIHPIFSGHDLQTISLKKEEYHFNLRPEIPPWLSCPSIFSSRLDQEFSHTQDSIHHENHNPNPNPNPNTSHVLPLYTSMASPHMSATALLQKAAQMGATMSKPSMLKPHNDHMFSDTGFDLGLSSCQDKKSGFVHGLTTFGNKAAISSGFMDHISETVNAETEATSHLQNIMNSLSSDNDFDASSFEDVFHGVLNSKRDENPNENLFNTTKAHLSRNDEGSRGGGNDGMTRDFLGLRAFSHTDILKFAGFDQQYQPQNQKPWQG